MTGGSDDARGALPTVNIDAGDVAMLIEIELPETVAPGDVPGFDDLMAAVEQFNELNDRGAP